MDPTLILKISYTLGFSYKKTLIREKPEDLVLIFKYLRSELIEPSNTLELVTLTPNFTPIKLVGKDLPKVSYK